MIYDMNMYEYVVVQWGSEVNGFWVDGRITGFKRQALGADVRDLLSKPNGIRYIELELGPPVEDWEAPLVHSIIQGQGRRAVPVKARTWIKNDNENSPKGKMYFQQSITIHMHFCTSNLVM
jgi:hypothetical protein